MTEHVGRQLREQLARPEPVGDHDVRLGQQLPAADRDEAGVTRAAADQGHAREPLRGDGGRRSCPTAARR